MQEQPDWYYNEFVQSGIDLDNAELVDEYDNKQGSDDVAEQKLLNELGINPGDTVVDLGCGTGSFALQAARHSCRVQAVDVAENMLAFVQKKAASQQLNITCVHAGFLTWTFAAGSLHHIISRFALHHLPDFWKQIALNRIYDALAEGGQLFLRDVVFSFDARNHEQAIENWVTRMPQQSGFAKEEFETHVREEFSTYDWVVEGMLQRAGFKLSRVDKPAAEYADFVCVK